jgi:hypothetical protein
MKPCPFCGNALITFQETPWAVIPPGGQMRCDRCRAAGPIAPSGRDSASNIAAARQLWDDRAETRTVRAKLNELVREIEVV